ncbi:MAG TPA: bifunctional precorrin-2 dehydrogenase/sirohydrochlorin ferrochelatase [Geobacteraceae bacterium]
MSSMRYLPINLDIRGKPVIIVGGGSVATRKCLALLSAGARVTVIAPALTASLSQCVQRGEVIHLPRNYAKGDLSGAFLVFAAANSRAVNRAVARAAKELGIPVDIADAPDTGDFVSPAYLSRGDLLITVSTGGRSPALAGRIRRELEDRYGPEYAMVLRLMGKVREKLLTEKRNSSYNKKILSALVEQDLPELIKNGRATDIDHLLLKLCGPGYSLAGLGMGDKDNE